MREWWKESVAYQIYPSTFYDANNDGYGDLKGITLKLNYLKYLGVDLIWICPFFKSPMDDQGYDISDYRMVDPRFGTNDDLKELLDTAHSMGIKVLFDFVMNHTSDEHKWFIEAKMNKESDKHDYYIWAEGKEDGSPPTNWQSFFSESAWQYCNENEEYYLKIFSSKMPDLNWKNQKLRNEMFDVARYYLDLGVDGFRLDAISHLAKDTTFMNSSLPISEFNYAYDTSKFSNLPKLFDYMKEFKDEVLSQYNSLTIGEVGGCAGKDISLKFVDPEHGSIDMVFNFDTCWENGAYGSEDKSDDQIITNVLSLKKIFNEWIQHYKGKAWFPLYWCNHDHPRVLSQYGSIEYRNESAKMLGATLLFMGGTPFIYNGEEIGMSNVTYTSYEEFKEVSAQNYIKASIGRLSKDEILRFLRRTSRINARTIMQWDASENAGFSKGECRVAVNHNMKEVNVAAQIDDESSILNFYRKCIYYRKNIYMDTVLDGEFTLIDENNEDIFAYERTDDKYKISVISNFRNKEVRFDISMCKEIILQNYDSILKDTKGCILRPFEVIIMVDTYD